MFNEFVPLRLLAVADTGFALMVVMLKRFKLVKVGLQSMVISDRWSCYKEDDTGKTVVVRDWILDELWWDKIDYVLSFTGPIYDMLRSCDTDKPNLHLVHEMWDSMIHKVKMEIYRYEGMQMEDTSSFYEVVNSIIVDRWTKSSTPLYCLAHSLNLKYYTQEWCSEHQVRVPPHRDIEISEERNKCLRRYFPSPEERKLVNLEYPRFSGALDVFGGFDSLQDRWTLNAKAWWLVHGASTPILQSIALKLLGQPCSSSCCERNWSTYSFIHFMRRNKITPQRTEDLVFVHINFRLLSKKSEQYNRGENKMWDIGRDAFDPLEGAGVFEIADLSLDEPDMKSVLFNEE